MEDDYSGHEIAHLDDETIAYESQNAKMNAEQRDETADGEELDAHVIDLAHTNVSGTA